jgi:hypothetical protein
VTEVAAAANSDAFLNHDKHGEKSLAEILKARVTALQGVSEGDAGLSGKRSTSNSW